MNLRKLKGKSGERDKEHEQAWPAKQLLWRGG